MVRERLLKKAAITLLITVRDLIVKVWDRPFQQVKILKRRKMSNSQALRSTHPCTRNRWITVAVETAVPSINLVSAWRVVLMRALRLKSLIVSQGMSLIKSLRAVRDQLRANIIIITIIEFKIPLRNL